MKKMSKTAMRNAYGGHRAIAKAGSKSGIYWTTGLPRYGQKVYWVCGQDNGNPCSGSHVSYGNHNTYKNKCFVTYLYN